MCFREVAQFICVIAAAAACAVIGSSAHADTCNANSTDELQRMLIQNSPFEGEWRVNDYSGPTNMSFNEIAGVFYVSWEGSGEDRRLWGFGRQHTVTFSSSTDLSFDSGGKGPFDLSLTQDCRLEVTQINKHGRTVRHSLSPVETVHTTMSVSQPPFDTSEELVSYLVQASPFEGTWVWADRTRDFAVSFIQKDGQLFAQSVAGENETGDDGVEVELMTPSTIVYSFPNSEIVAHLSLPEQGRIQGVLVSRGVYALIANARANGN